MAMTASPQLELPVNKKPTYSIFNKRKAASNEPQNNVHPFFLGKTSAAATLTINAIPEKPKSLSSTEVRTPPKRRASAAFPELKEPNAGANSPSKQAAPKFPYAIEPPWPGKGLNHIRGLDRNLDAVHREKFESSTLRFKRRQRKLKGNAILVPRSEDLITDIVQNLSRVQQIENHPQDLIRIPERLVLSPSKIQHYVKQQTHARLPQAQTSYQLKANVSNKLASIQGSGGTKVHPALLKQFYGLRTALSPFDKCECESQPWTQKYSPNTASEVLQSGREALILHDWLRSLTVVSVDNAGKILSQSTKSAKASKKSTPAKNNTSKINKKKRKKRAEELDGFIISSSEGEDEMDEISDYDVTDLSSNKGSASKKTVVRAGDIAITAGVSGSHSKKLTNAIVISGPNGCGKTAAVYAVAKELDFQVFEINPGSRRNGKDVLEKVGEMTQYHQVTSDRKSSSADDTFQPDEATQTDLDSGKQIRMDSFFKKGFKGPSKKTNPPISAQSKERENGPSTNKSNNLSPNKANCLEGVRSTPQQQMQSLILLEEVDIIFDEDKQFWATILALIQQSKRPVIMTCNDESVLPIGGLSLHAILRFTPPPQDLAVDYLLLVAASEGHILDRGPLNDLYRSKDQDLRASIMDLDFHCQIGVGDRKGGLEWILERCPPGSDINPDGETLRVISKNTYRSGMGWFGRNSIEENKNRSMAEEELLQEAWNSWSIDVDDWQNHANLIAWSSGVSKDTYAGGATKLDALDVFETFLEAISAADIYASSGMRTGYQVCTLLSPLTSNWPYLPSKISLEPQDPIITESFRNDLTLDRTYIHSDPTIEHSNLSNQLSIAIKCLAKRFLRKETPTFDPGSHKYMYPLQEKCLIESITSRRPPTTLTRGTLAEAFDPIASSPNVFNHNQGIQLSVFDRSISLLTTDLAPYVRSIVAHDLRLEQDRLQLSNLLSQGGTRSKKRQRTTRSSRSALEGGSRATTRRERWFQGLVPELVMRSGGKMWREAVVEWEESQSLGHKKLIDNSSAGAETEPWG
ncbi:MAG: hypothetical protein M1829_004521 [Trizodia sp. TS-e1964]|nr:MAG: hypothetical protein M1829_004521 [Trizodia sp. TS-e1964]